MSSGNDYMLNDRLYIIPQDPETREALLNVDRATKEELRLKHHVFVDADWQCNTIANAYIETIIRALGLDVKNTGNSKASWNCYGLFNAHVTVKRNEDAEKEGNINIAFDPEEEITTIIKDSAPKEQIKYDVITPEAAYSFPNNGPLNEAYKKIDQVARMELHEKYSITIPDNWVVTAVTVTFVRNLIRQLLYMVANNGKAAASINFNDNIECHAIMKNDGVVITLRPGMSAKLLIKSDEATEADEADDDE